MKQVRAIYPKSTVTNATLTLSLLAVGVLIVMATLQLITFEKFIPIMQNYEVPGGPVAGKILAAIIVILEVAALPFLLRMKVSPLFRLCSALSLFFIGTIWIGIASWALFHQSPLIGSGIIGSLFKSLPAEMGVVIGVFLLASAVILIYQWRQDIKINSTNPKG